MGYGTNGLSFNTLREANLKRLPQFRDKKGRLSHPGEGGDGSNWSLAEWACAVTGELGELCNVLKKVKRGDLLMDEARPEIAKELADVVTYLDILAMRCGVNLGEATMEKFNEVSRRVGSDIRLGVDDWYLASTTQKSLEARGEDK